MNLNIEHQSRFPKPRFVSKPEIWPRSSRDSWMAKTGGMPRFWWQRRQEGPAPKMIAGRSRKFARGPLSDGRRLEFQWRLDDEWD
jgi:hypothetical protein